MKKAIFIMYLMIFLGLVGYIRCVYKFVTCDFEPSYRAEVIYGVGTFTGLGSIIGWINIDD